MKDFSGPCEEKTAPALQGSGLSASYDVQQKQEQVPGGTWRKSGSRRIKKTAVWYFATPSCARAVIRLEKVRGPRTVCKI